ncbi:MAG: flagellar biosynthesis protein FlhF [Defluviitaleaceae bacterium]|nr:flagellar biosynthesis protein FlhF [Defluviitaleaceae bacterium]
MRVKRFEGKKEEAILAQIREEMGPEATIVSTRTKPYPAPLGWFLKPRLVVTASYETDETFAPRETPAPAPSILQAARDIMPKEDADPEESIEESLALLLQEARKVTLQTETKTKTEGPKSEIKQRNKNRTKYKKDKASHVEAVTVNKYKNPLVQSLYNTLLTQDVLPEVAARLLGDLSDLPAHHTDVKEIVKTVYGNIVDLLSNPTLIATESADPQTVIFMGPTGVGKTTTIAKLSSLLSLKYELNVGLVTADTYRIAAVEQLKTYADILGLEIRTIYKADEMSAQIKSLVPPHNIILVDTAGRSHKNKDNLSELKLILDEIPESVRYLVLSINTRYKDLIGIVNAYSKITEFDLIFTKLDESDNLGNLINVCCLTGRKPAYVTFGQSVPEDFDAVKSDNIARSLLGLNGETSYTSAQGEQKSQSGGGTP